MARDLDWSDVVADGERMRDEQNSTREGRIEQIEQALGGPVDTQILWDVLYTLADRGGLNLDTHDGSRVVLTEPDPDEPGGEVYIVVDVHDADGMEIDEFDQRMANRHA